MEWLRRVPTPVVVTLVVMTGLLLLAVLGGFVALSWAGKPTEDYWVFINRMANLLTFPLAAVGAAGGISAARSANQAAEQTNGHLAEKDTEIAELRGQLAAVLRQPYRPGGPNG